MRYTSEPVQCTAYSVIKKKCSGHMANLYLALKIVLLQKFHSLQFHESLSLIINISHYLTCVDIYNGVWRVWKISHCLRTTTHINSYNWLVCCPCPDTKLVYAFYSTCFLSHIVAMHIIIFINDRIWFNSACTVHSLSLNWHKIKWLSELDTYRRYNEFKMLIYVLIM